jgi:site-specific DNA recombinase
MKQIEGFTKFAKGDKVIATTDSDCVIYTRVSTKEQAEGNLSLETQRKACDLHAAKQGYNITAYFGGTYESAATDERKEFKRLIEFCKRHKKESLKIIVYSLDRFSRTGDNAIWLSRQLRDLGVQIVSVTQPIDTKNPAGVLQQNILFLFSQYDNDLRRQKTIAGMKEKLLQGIWPCHAPLGYDHVTINGEKSIVVNEKGKLLRKAFFWKANEGITIVEIVKRLESNGFKINHNRVSEILTNAFYCGLLSHSLLEGELVEGKHEKLVSKEIFLKANQEKGKIPHAYKASPINDNLPLKQYARCENCGENLRGYLVKKKKLYYYKCDNGSKCSCNISAKKLHELFKVILSEITLDENYLKLFKLELRKIFDTLNKKREEVADQYEAKIKELNEKIERLEERFINDEIKSDLYQKYSKKYNQEKEEMEAFLQNTSFTASNLDQYTDRAVEYAWNLTSTWDSSDFREKVKLQKMVFPDGFYYNKKNGHPRTTKMNPVFSLIARLKANTEENKTGTSEVIFKNSGLVVPTGIEPVSKV